MSNLTKFSSTWQEGPHKIEVRVTLILFEDSNTHVVYCPALDLSGYGQTEKEAMESFRISLEEFIHYTINKKTFYNELRRLGWKIKGQKAQNRSIINPPNISDLLQKNANFNNIFNNFPFRKIDEQIELPV